MPAMVEDTRKPAVRVRAGALHAAMKDVLGVVEARNTIPILSHVRVAAGNGRIEITASDLDIWAVRELASDDRGGPASKEWIESIRPFAIAVPAKPLGDVLGAVDGDAMVTLTAAHGDEPRAVVSAGKARFKLACLPVDDFPLPPPFNTAEASFELPCSSLADAFARVEHAISSDETRYYINGVYVHPAQAEGAPLDLRFAATDGSRLARLTLDIPDGGASWPAVIVARKTVGVLDKLLAAAAKTTEGKEIEPASVLVEANGDGKGCLLRFELPAVDGGTVEIVAKTIDGDFPDYQRVIPSAPPHRAVVNRASLAEAVKRVMVLASASGENKSRAVRAEFGEGKVTLSARSADLGEATEELDCTWSGPACVVGFDGAKWRETLLALASEEVAMSFEAGADGERNPVRFAAWDGTEEAGALVQVLMPMRV